MRFNAYVIIERAVDEGVTYGYNRAHKHNDKPSDDEIRQQITFAIMNSICEVIEFGEVGEL